jgi:hypothetical protein
MRRSLFFYLSAFFIVSLKAQLNSPCSTEESAKKIHEANPVLQRRWQQIEAFARHYQENSVANVNNNNLVVTIPVVFHVVWNTPVQNISLAQIQSQIDVLNEDFRRLNADTFKTKNIFKPIAGDARVQFCLASRAPNGDTTSGVTRTQTNKTSFSCTDSMKFTAQGGQDGWPSAQYLNIWVCNLNCANGYAYYPGTNDPYDGVVIHWYVCGRTGNIYSGCKGRTGSHETGHWMGLYHTFEYGVCNGASLANCAGGGDKVCDTPSSSAPNYGCITSTNSCVDSPNDLPDQNENYMDYADDTCKNMFSKGQAARMRSMLFSYRQSLLTSLGCIPANTSYTDVVMVDAYNNLGFGCSGTVTPKINIGNAGTGNLNSLVVSYSLNGTPSQQTLNVSVPSTSFALLPLNPIAVAPGNYTMNITLSNPNGGPDGNLQNNSFTYTFTELTPGNGNPPPVAEGFESAVFAPSGWTIQNADNDAQWEKTGDASGFAASAASAVFRNFYNGSTNKRDALISPPILIALNSSSLTFDVAYCQPASPYYSDTLKVYASTNCGNAWTQLYVKGGNALSTAPAQTVFSEFVPSASQWRTESINLSAYAGQATTLKFENVSFWGNDLYLDNINIPVSVGIAGQPAQLSYFYYDYENGLLKLQAAGGTGPVKIKVYDVSGRMVAGGETQNGIFRLPALPPGYYLADCETAMGQNTIRKFVKFN